MRHARCVSGCCNSPYTLPPVHCNHNTALHCFGLHEAAELGARSAGVADEAPQTCWLCQPPLGPRVEQHHPVPKSRGGRQTVPVHPICHRTLHRTLTNKELERTGGDVAALRGQPDIARFVAWVANKPPDFHAPTRKRR